MGRYVRNMMFINRNHFFGIKRTTFIINKEGKIINIYKNVDVDSHSRDILNFLKID